MKLKKSLFNKIGSLLLIGALGCSSINTKDETFSKESWKNDNYIDSIQILLTNDYLIDNSMGYGASSFLIQAKNDILLCTAKHLLGEAMGISPEIKTNVFNTSFKYWLAYPRQDSLSNDTIIGTKLINEEINSTDIILLDCNFNRPLGIKPLKPRFSKIKDDEQLELIGCEYSNSECYQNKFDVIMNSYQDGKILVTTLEKFIPNGFSGAPVIDKNGFVVGVLSGGGEFEGELYLYIEPITLVENWLKK